VTCSAARTSCSRARVGEEAPPFRGPAADRTVYSRPVPDPVQSERAARLMELLGLSDDELCALLDADPLTLLSGQLDHRPELGILLDLLADAEELAGAPALRRWVRIAGPAGRPVDALTRRDFPAFEDALADLADRGFIVRGGGSGRG
jgi:hypothetical protein